MRPVARSGQLERSLGGFMRRSISMAVTLAAAVALGGCGSRRHQTSDVRHYSSAQAIADALTKAGLTVSMLHKQTEESYISQVGGTAYDFTVTDKAGMPAGGDSGINMFPNREALT